MIPARTAFSMSVTQDGGSSGRTASKVTAAAESRIVSVPDCREATGLPISWPTRRSMRRSGSVSMAKRKACGLNVSFRTRPRLATVPSEL